MNRCLHADVGRNAPLELLLAVVNAAAASTNCKTEFVLSLNTPSYRTLKETAFAAMSHLMKHSQVVVTENIAEFEGLRITAGNQSVVFSTNSEKVFLKCLHLLDKSHVDPVHFESFASARLRRFELMNHCTARSAILIGNGPSLNNVDLKHYSDALTIGCNKIGLLPYDFNLKHCVFEDRVVAEDSFREQLVSDTATIWLPHDLAHLSDRANYYCLDRFVEAFPRFSESPEIAYSGWTVMFVMLQLTYWMGVEEVYLVGVDGGGAEPPHTEVGGVCTSIGNDDGHFTPTYYGPGSRYQRADQQRVLQAYQLANLVYQRAGRRVVNCSLGSKVQAFPMGQLPPPGYFNES